MYQTHAAEGISNIYRAHVPPFIRNLHEFRSDESSRKVSTGMLILWDSRSLSVVNALLLSLSVRKTQRWHRVCRDFGTSDATTTGQNYLNAQLKDVAKLGQFCFECQLVIML